MEAFFQSDLKMWVVTAVLLIILGGLIFTLFGSMQGSKNWSRNKTNLAVFYQTMFYKSLDYI